MNKEEFENVISNVGEDARNWILDCTTTEECWESVMEWSHSKCIAYVRRNYSGGLRQFLEDGK